MRTDYKYIVFAELPFYVRGMINQIIEREGSELTDHEADYKTKFGIRRYSADKAGYYGSIEGLDRDTASRIWAAEYYYSPRIHLIAELSPLIAQTVLDTAGPAGHVVAIKHLQRALTFFNAIVGPHGIYGLDLEVDGIIGRKTLDHLRRYLDHRARDHGERKLAALLNSLQAVHFVEVSERNPAKRVFAYGWISGRVVADLDGLTSTDEAFA